MLFFLHSFPSANIRFSAHIQFNSLSLFVRTTKSIDLLWNLFFKYIFCLGFDDDLRLAIIASSFQKKKRKLLSQNDNVTHRFYLFRRIDKSINTHTHTHANTHENDDDNTATQNYLIISRWCKIPFIHWQSLLLLRVSILNLYVCQMQ